MLSVVVYGRNDSHGYNLHKRAAISLNCIAAVLDHPSDEILFVDCNTPDDLPTFPEAIQDTLTKKARHLLRIFRVRPWIFEKHRKGSGLKVVEPLSRNVAIRRSSPDNRWVLSTNTDMIFLTREPQQSLSDVVAGLDDGFYETARFELPEVLWEQLPRSRPSGVIAQVRRWGTRLHLNEVVYSHDYNVFDAPGDFQLGLRRQLFEIHGFNEAMTLGWHVDSNMCKRMSLLNGRTDSALDHVVGYHCDHTRQANIFHSANRSENDQGSFVTSVVRPELPDQAEDWGAPSEVIEEIRLGSLSESLYVRTLETLLPGINEHHTEEVGAVRFNAGLFYDNNHAVPYLADHLATLPQYAVVYYCGANPPMLRALIHMRRGLGQTGLTYYERSAIDMSVGGDAPIGGDGILDGDADALLAKVDIFIFDCSLHHLDGVPKHQPIETLTHPSSTDFVGIVTDRFHECVLNEHSALARPGAVARKFLFIGSGNTFFEDLFRPQVGAVQTPHGSHVRHGFVYRDLAAVPPATGSEPPLAQRLAKAVGRTGGIPEAEIQHTQALLQSLADTADPIRFLQAHRAELTPLALRYIDCLVDAAASSDPVLAGSREQALRSFRNLLERISYPSLLREALAAPISDAPTRNDSLNKLCDALDWERPDWFHFVESMHEAYTRNYLTRHRVVWENAQLAFGLQRLGLLHHNSRILVVMAQPDRLTWLLTRHCRHVHAMQLVQADVDAKSVSTDRLYSESPIPFDAGRLVAEPLTEMPLPFVSGVFDAAVAAPGVLSMLCADEGGGGVMIHELGRVVKPGGTVAVAGDVDLNGHAGDRSLTLSDLGADDGGRLRFRLAGLTPIEPFDFALNAHTLGGYVPCGGNVNQRPHFVVETASGFSTSFTMFTRKAVAQRETS